MSARKNNDTASDRRALVEKMRREQERSERRRNALFIGAAVLVGVLIVGAAAVQLMVSERRTSDIEAAAEEPIEGVQEFSDLGRNHVTTPVDYPQTPPVGGDHAGVWTNCGAYTEPVEPTQAVHSLEHGAVWVTYAEDLPADQVEALTELTAGESFALLSPFDGLDAPIVASAWGTQLAVDSADDQRLAVFLQAYQQGPQTPEPGAPCSGGVDG